jgi:23S rRNA pseudouridine2605 synthase
LQKKVSITLKERVQKVIAERGLCSRRAAEKLIAENRVKVNGRPIKLGATCDPARDLITVDGQKLLPKTEKKNLYILLHKPRGYVTTLSDEKGRKTVTGLVKVSERIYPVGRLDMLSEGLLLMTNDGELTHVLTHPSYEIPKEYLVTVLGDSEAAIPLLREGVTLDDGFQVAPATVSLVRAFDDKSILSITISQGHNRQVRRMCEAVGLTVRRLVRVSIGNLKLEGIPLGKWRHASIQEERYLRKLVKEARK